MAAALMLPNRELLELLVLLVPPPPWLLLELLELELLDCGAERW